MKKETGKMCDNVFTIDDDERRVKIQDNWYDFAQTIVTSFDIAQKPAKWSSQPSDGVAAADDKRISTATGKILSVYKSVLGLMESPSSGSFMAYEACVSPFMSSFGDFDSDAGWLQRKDETDLDWFVASSFIRNNIRSKKEITVDRGFYFLDEDSFYELGRIGNKKLYALKFIKKQHVNDDDTPALVVQDAKTKEYSRVTTKDTQGAVPALGLFGYVTLQEKDIFLKNTSDKSLVIQPLSSVTSKPFIDICGLLIFTEIVLRFMNAQQIDKTASEFSKPYVSVVSDSNPSFGKFTIPAEAYSSWSKDNTDRLRTRLQLRIADSAPTPASTVPTQTAVTTQVPTPAPTQGATSAPVPIVITKTSTMSKFAIGLVIAAIVCSVVGTLLMLMILMKWLFSSSKTSIEILPTQPSMKASVAPPIQVPKVYQTVAPAVTTTDIRPISAWSLPEVFQASQ